MKKPGADWEKWYHALRAADPEAYCKALSYSEAVTLNHDTPMKVAAEYERSMVVLACDLLKIRP